MELKQNLVDVAPPKIENSISNTSEYKSNFYSTGKWEIEEYDQSEWGPPFKPCNKFFCKKTAMELFGSRKKYDKIKYFGDGKNDLHAAMALGKNDIIFPRKYFRLDNLVSNGENEIKANVSPWQDGKFIGNAISN